MKSKKGSGVANFFGRWIENTSEASGDLHDLADRVAGEQAAAGKQFQDKLNSSGNVAEQNIKDSYVRSYAGKAGLWLSKPMNLGLVIGGFFLILFGVYKAG